MPPSRSGRTPQSLAFRRETCGHCFAILKLSSLNPMWIQGFSHSIYSYLCIYKFIPISPPRLFQYLCNTMAVNTPSLFFLIASPWALFLSLVCLREVPQILTWKLCSPACMWSYLTSQCWFDHSYSSTILQIWQPVSDPLTLLLAIAMWVDQKLG